MHVRAANSISITAPDPENPITISSDVDVSFLAGASITLSAGFTVMNGAAFSASTDMDMLQVENKVDTRYQFTGQEKDVSGLYYYGARYYDPDLGRFNQPDTLLDGLNRYAYCQNNPVKYSDPTGHRAVIDDDENGNPIFAVPDGKGGWDDPRDNDDDGNSTTPVTEETVVEPVIPLTTTTYTFGWGFGLILSMDFSMGLGIENNPEKELLEKIDIFGEVKFGWFVGGSGKLGGAIGETPGGLDTLHDDVPQIVRNINFGVGPVVTFDKNARYTGISGIGVGGGITVVGRKTSLRGIIRDFLEFYNKFYE